MQYWVISNFRLIWSYLGVLSTHTHASNIKKPLCQSRIQVKIPLKPGSTTLSRTHWHTDNICMQIPQSLGPTTLSPPILVTSNPQKYPNMERWSVHPFLRSLRIEPCWARSFCVVKILKTIQKQQPSHAFLISFSRFFNSIFISKYQQPLSLRILNIFQHISSVQPGDIHHISPETWPKNMPGCVQPTAPGRCIGDALSILVIQLQICGASDSVEISRCRGRYPAWSTRPGFLGGLMGSNGIS